VKIKLLAATAATLVASSAMAQSAFQGFYGQLSTGYENNSASGLSSPLTLLYGGQSLTAGSVSAPNQSFGGAPLIAGLGYNFSVAPKWLIGVGADYSFLSQQSASYNYSLNYSLSGPGVPEGISLSGAKIKVSNRLNIFVATGYEIDKDKLVYLKAGFSSVKGAVSAPTNASTGGQTIAISESGFSPSGQSKTLNGYILGVGYKQIISGGFYAFAEGNYMNYGKQNFGKTTPGPYDSTLTTNTSSGLNTYQLLVGVGYRF
jgi:opacity protein-like surface antigen